MKYSVEVCRIGYGFATLNVEAESKEEAEFKALNLAGGYEYNEKDSDYITNRALPKDKESAFVSREAYAKQKESAKQLEGYFTYLGKKELRSGMNLLDEAEYFSKVNET